MRSMQPEAALHLARRPHHVWPLQVLKLHGSSLLTAAGAAALRSLTALTSLALDSCKDTEAGALLGQGLLSPGLRQLTLRGLAFGNMFASCVQLPACASSLTKLVVSGSLDLSDAKLRKVCRFYPALQELLLPGCLDLTDGGLAAAAAQLPRLRVLDVSGTRISGAFVEPLTGRGSGGGAPPGAAAGPQLAQVSLRGCSLVTDGSLGQVAACLAHCMQALDVSDCSGVSDRGVLGLLQGMPQLGKLNVSGCRKVSKGVLLSVPHYMRVVHTIGS
jgi:hypothetical protein